MAEKKKKDGRSTPIKSPKNIPLSDKRIKLLQLLRANGASYGNIALISKHSKSTISKYCKEITILPRHMQVPIGELLGRYIKPKYNFNQTKKTKKPLKDAFTQREMTDVDYWIDNHIEGNRFQGPLDLIKLDKLQELMDIPTGFHSTLPITDWAVKYLGGRGDGHILQHPPHLWSQSQFDMMNFWRHNKRSMFETFRDAGKTMVATAILSHEIPEYRDNNYFIMSETDIKASKRIRQIGNILLTNKEMIADYGFLPHFSTRRGKRETWSAKEITVKRDFSQTDPTLMSFSTETAGATGAHFAGGVFDDVWSFKLEQKSVDNKIKWFGWRDNELEGCLEDAWELFLLTRKGPYDLYQDLEDSNMYAVFKRPAVASFPSKWKAFYNDVNGRKVFDRIDVYSEDYAINDDGNGRFSIEYFLYKKLKMKHHAFESEYQLNPLELVGKYFKTEMIRPMHGFKEFMYKMRDKAYRIVASMDLAFSSAPTADYNALTVWVLYNGQFYFLNTYLKRTASDADRVEMLQKAKDDFPTLITVYIEADLQQSAKVKELQKKCGFVRILPSYARDEQRKLRSSDDLQRAGLSGKAARIHSQWEDVIEAGICHVNVSMRHYSEFQDELKRFPKCEHFDVLDAGGIAISVLKGNAALLFAKGGGYHPLRPVKKFFIRSSNDRGGWD